MTQDTFPLKKEEENQSSPLAIVASKKRKSLVKESVTSGRLGSRKSRKSKYAPRKKPTTSLFPPNLGIKAGLYGIASQMPGDVQELLFKVENLVDELLELCKDKDIQLQKAVVNSLLEKLGQNWS